MKTAIYAGLIAGTIDVGAACTINMIGPGPILRFIASGLLGAPLPHETWVYCLGLGLQWMMSIIIAGIGCHQGMEVGGDVESLGRRVTASVVHAIFATILIDAIFALIYMKLNI